MLAWKTRQANAINVLRDELFLELHVGDGDYITVKDQVTPSYPQASSFMNTSLANLIDSYHFQPSGFPHLRFGFVGLWLRIFQRMPLGPFITTLIF